MCSHTFFSLLIPNLSVLLPIIPLRFVSSINFAIIILKLKAEADFPSATQLFLNAIFTPK